MYPAALIPLAAGVVVWHVGIRQDSAWKAGLTTIDCNTMATVVEQASDGMLITDTQGTIRYANPAFCRMTGYQLAEVLGKNPRFLKSGKQGPEFYENLWRTLRARQVWHGELTNRRKDGSLYEEEMSITPVHNRRGVTTGYIGIKRDVTERKLQQDALRESEEKYRLLLDNIPEVVGIIDETGRAAFVTPNVEELLGYTQKEVVEAGSWFERVHPEDAAWVQRDFLKFLFEGGKLDGEFRLQRKDGRWIWVHAQAMRSLDRKVIGVMSDITARRQAQDALRKSEERYRRLFDRNLAGVFRSTLDGRIVESNQAQAHIVGYGSAAELLASGVRAMDLYGDRADRDRMIQELGVRGALTNHEVQFRRRDGEIVWVLMNAGLVEDEVDGTCLEGTFIDITERKRNEEALRASEEKYRLLVDNIPDAVWLAEPSGHCFFITPNIEAIIGYKPEEIYASGSWFDRVHPDDQPGLYEEFSAFLETGAKYSHEYRIRHKNGEWIWVHGRAMRSVNNARGRYIIGVTSDISGRKRNEAALLFKNALLQAQSETALDAILVVDDNNRIILSNEAFARIFQVPEELIRAGDDPPVLAHVMNQMENPEAFLEKVYHLMERRDEKSRDELKLKGDRTVDRYSSPLVDSNGKYWGRIWYFRDITERKRAEEEFRKIAAVVEASSDFIGLASIDGEVQFINHAGRRLVGLEPDTPVTGSHIFDYTPEEDRQPVSAQLAPHLAREGRWAGEIRFRNPRTGVLVPAWASTFYVTEPGTGRPIGLATICRDLTERKRVEEEILAAQQAAEAANRAKSEFLANMSHEIRTPLNGVLGMTDLVLDTELQPEQRENLEIARSSADALLGVINDILDFSKIEARKLELERIAFNPREMLAAALKPLVLRAWEKGIDLICDVSPEVPKTIVGDPGRLRQVLLNLTGNALKFTEEGEVAVRVDAVSRRGDELVLAFTVRDTGVGIPAGRQAHIFDAFTQADTSVTRRFGGTGLGLTISRQLVTMMGGTISVESEVSKGSTFRFTACFGVGSGETEEPARAAVASLSKVRVIAVDDNRTNRRVLEEMLESWGLTPAMAESGEQALDQMGRAAREGNPYSLALVDAKMPGMDGFQVVERIRQDPNLAGCSLIMLTSAGRPGDAARCREIGVAAYLTKPVAGAELLETMLRVLAMKSGGSGKPQLVTRHLLRETRSALRVLVVDDNVVNRRVAVRLLEKHGHTAQSEESGEDALHALARSHFDLVLMDVQMPGMDGFEATREIRRREQSTGAHVPIIAMTALAMEGDRQRCMAAGMDAYVSKPISVKELLIAIENVCPQHVEVG